MLLFPNYKAVFPNALSLRHYSIVGLGLVLIAASCRQEEPLLPNIILINIDDMGWEDVGFMGSTFYETPNMDQLATNSMVFEEGYAAAANCAPSRACLMTGRWTPRHGIYTVDSSERGLSEDRKLIPVPNTTTLDSSWTTLPQILQATGYRTVHAGKWHLSHDPLPFGFDINIGGSHAGNPGSYYPPYKRVNLSAPNEHYLTDLIMDRVLTCLDTINQPFLLNYSPYAVHTPIHPIDSILFKYKGKASWRDQSNIEYATMVENLDRNIGRLLNQLVKMGVGDRTMIILTSDNGGLYGITYQRPLRDGKGSYYEGGIRVPLLWHWPNHIKPGRIEGRPVTHLDVFPTIMDVLDNTSTLDLDGQSLKPLLMDQITDLEAQPLFWHFPVYLQSYDLENNQSRDPLFRTRPGSVVRIGDWKLHHYYEDDGIELYNLKNDIGETENLKDTFPEKTNELYTLLDNWRKKVKAPIPHELNPAYIENK